MTALHRDRGAAAAALDAAFAELELAQLPQRFEIIAGRRGFLDFILT